MQASAEQGSSPQPMCFLEGRQQHQGEVWMRDKKSDLAVCENSDLKISPQCEKEVVDNVTQMYRPAMDTYFANAEGDATNSSLESGDPVLVGWRLTSPKCLSRTRAKATRDEDAYNTYTFWFDKRMLRVRIDLGRFQTGMPSTITLNITYRCSTSKQ